MRIVALIILASSILLGGCKEPEPPKKSEIPFISVVSISPKTVVEFSDSIEILLKYEDGDGDIGWVDADKYALTVHDFRLLAPDVYYVPPLSPVGEEIPISGILKVKIKNTFLLGSGTSETTYFDLQLTDRAGNQSNHTVTENITINRN